MVPRGERISNDPDLLDNIQAWVDNGYDTRILHRNLAFPLLRELARIGDPIAKEVFKDEVIDRLVSGHSNVILYLFKSNYLDIFTDDELTVLLNDISENNQEKAF